MIFNVCSLAFAIVLFLLSFITIQHDGCFALIVSIALCAIGILMGVCSVLSIAACI